MVADDSISKVFYIAYTNEAERSEVKLVPTHCAVGVGGNGLVPAP